MASMDAGRWMIGLFIYFFILFTIVSFLSLSLNEIGTTNTLQFNDVGLIQSPDDTSFYQNNTVSASDDVDIGAIQSTFGILTGIGASDVDIGIPEGYVWMFSFIFFWIPFLILIWALYMSLPFLH